LRCSKTTRSWVMAVVRPFFLEGVPFCKHLSGVKVFDDIRTGR
jgi:hypothetical protein